MMDQGPFQLRDIFCLTPGKEVFTTNDLFSLNLRPEFIDHLCGCLKLDFDKTTAKGNLCFSNTREVRADFRTSFNKSDVISFIAANHPERTTLFSNTEVVIPSDAIGFWT